jgi:hypothetical protein
MPKAIKSKMERKDSTCNLGCRSSEAKNKKSEINRCRFKRNPTAVVKTRIEGPIKNLNGEFQHLVLKSRYFSIPLFQDPGISNDKKLIDFTAEYSLSVYNGKEKTEILVDDGSSCLLQKLRGQVFLRMMLLRIDDSILEKKKDLNPKDIFVDIDDPESSFHEGIVAYSDGREYIDSTKNDFDDFTFRLCCDFKGLPVHVCSSNPNENIVFDKGVFVFFVYIIYMPCAMEIRKLRFNSDDSDFYNFGEKYNISTGDVGYSMIINRSIIEYAYEDSIIDNGKLNLTEQTLKDLLAKIGYSNNCITSN